MPVSPGLRNTSLDGQFIACLYSVHQTGYGALLDAPHIYASMISIKATVFLLGDEKFEKKEY